MDNNYSFVNLGYTKASVALFDKFLPIDNEPLSVAVMVPYSGASLLGHWMIFVVVIDTFYVYPLQNVLKLLYLI